MLPQPSDLNPQLGSSIDWSHPLARGLAALWLLNEGSGTLAGDLVGRVHALPTSDRMWFGGAGLRFDGSNYAAFAHDARVFSGDEVSVFASIVPSAFGATHDDSALFTKGALPHTLYLTVGAGRLNVYTENNASWLDGSGSVPAGERSVVGFTKGSEGRRLWLNGRLDASDGVTGSLFWGPAGGRIGFRQDGFGAGFQGLIEWVAFWNRALLAEEAAGLGGSLVSLAV